MRSRETNPDTVTIIARDLTGGVAKYDPKRVGNRFARDASNWIMHSGSLQRRECLTEEEQFTRPSGAITFPGTSGNRLKIPRNAGCPIWTGLGRNWTLEFVEKPVADAGVGETLPLFRLYDTTDGDILAVYAKPSYSRVVVVQDADMGAASAEKSIGTAEVSTPLYYRIRRFGRHLAVEMYGASGGLQSETYTNVFSSEGVLMDASDSALYIGGDTSTKGPNSTIDEVRLTNRYLGGNRYRWLEYSWMEDLDLQLYLRMNEGSGSTTADESRFNNTGVIEGSVSWESTGLVQGVLVGQYVGDYGARTSRQRVIGIGGSIYREVLS